MPNRTTQKSAVELSSRLREEIAKILFERKGEGYKQKDMAEQLNISASAFSRFMAGITNASASLIANAMSELMIDGKYVNTGVRSKSDNPPGTPENN